MNQVASTIKTALKDYILDAKFKGLSNETLNNYEKAISYFLNFYQEKYGDAEIEGGKVKVLDVREWRDKMLMNGLAPSTVKEYMSRLSFFFTALSDPSLEDARVFDYNPVSDRLYPSVEKRPYENLIGAEDLSKLWSSTPPLGANKRNWIRNYAMVVVLLSTKMRNKELLDLTLEDVDFDEGEIYIRHGKGNKFRAVPLQPIAESALKLYLNSDEYPKDLPAGSPLFGTTAEHVFGGASSGKTEWHRGTSQWLSKTVSNHINMVTGLSGSHRTHSLRHAGSVLDLNSGTTFEELQSELGHASVKTTEIYAGRLMAKKQRNAARLSYEERDRQAEINNRILQGVM